MRTLHPSWEARPATIRLAIVASSAAVKIREPALAVIDRLQYLPAGIQLEALAAAFVIMANAIGQDAHELVSRAKRQVSEVEAFENDVLAVAQYAKGELA